jgi:hypothetical protein
VIKRFIQKINIGTKSLLFDAGFKSAENGAVKFAKKIMR